MSEHPLRWALLLSVLFVTGCESGREYSAEPVEGWIVDAESKEPVEGAVVVMSWPLYGGFWHADVTGYLYIGESVTDENGRFYFSAWGPRKVQDAIHPHSPFISVLKSGYFHKSFAEPNVIQYRNPLRSFLNGMEVELERYNNDKKRYEINMVFAHTFYPGGAVCTWESIPRYTAEVINTHIEYEIVPLMPSWGALSNGGKCRDAKQLLKNYLRH